MMHHLRRVAGFAFLPAFSLLAAVVLLPLIASRFGSGGWVTLGAGQSIGAVVTIVCGLSWAVTGGHAVAVGDAVERRRLFTLSLSSRSVMLAAVLPIATVVVVVVGVDYPFAAWLFMLGMALNSYTMGWYYGGAATPSHLAVNEGVVRLVGYVVASGLLVSGGDLWLYALVNVLASLTSLALNCRTVRRATLPHPPLAWADHLAELRSQLSGTVSRTGFALFTFGGPTIFALGATVAVAEFNAVDQMLKASVSATAILPQAFIAVVATRAALHARWWRRPESLVIVWLPLAAWSTWSLAGPQAAGFLFAGELDLSRTLSLLIGVALAATMSLRSFELLVLVPLGLTKVAFRINAIVSFGGVGLLYAAALADSVVAGLAAWIVIHAAIYAWELVALRHRASLSAAEASAPVAADPAGGPIAAV